MGCPEAESEDHVYTAFGEKKPLFPHSNHIEAHTNEVCDKAFIVMRTFTASTIAIQSMHSSRPGSMLVEVAPVSDTSSFSSFMLCDVHHILRHISAFWFWFSLYCYLINMFTYIFSLL